LATTGASLSTQPIGAGLLLLAGTAIAWMARREPRDEPLKTPESASSLGEAIRS
jgi:hypothetical protein